MSRPHIEFIQAQVLPWVPGLPGSEARSGVEAKTLSIDEETGASTCVVRYPEGWSQGSPQSVTADEEIFVLDGELQINGISYDRNSYAHLPAGYPRRDFKSEGGAVVLTFFGSRPDTGSAEGQYREDRLVERINAAGADWGNADIEAMGLTAIATGSRLLTLFSDPDTGEITYLTGVIPFRREAVPERHPVAQEFYILGGELAGNCGVMQAGAYCWRPPLVTHGPYGSPTGALILLRSIGGPLTTEFDPPVPHTYNAAHNPVLPPNYVDLGAAPLPSPARY
jgi:hypothetical protein